MYKSSLTASDIPFEYNPEHFRDPKIWKKDDKFYIACVLKQKNDCGCIVLFKSEDAIKWSYKGILDTSKDNLSKMWECPDVSVIDGKESVVLEVNTIENFISYDRSNIETPGSVPFRKAKLRTDSNKLKLKIICDTNSLEVFINDGIMAFTNIFFFKNSESDLIIANNTSAEICYNFWKIEK